MTRGVGGEVTLERANASDELVLGNLLELYIHDLSAIFTHVKLGDDGRFGYPDLSSYLTEAGSRCAFFIRHTGRLVGFVLARQGTPASSDPNMWDIAEFFVLKQFRLRGVGRGAARLLWDRLPGAWSIRAATSNPRAVDFWRKVVAEYSDHHFTESKRPFGSSSTTSSALAVAHWVVFLFETTPAQGQ